MTANLPATDPMIGRLIGHYRLVHRIGEGGMGAVYLAERAGEFRQQVAIKLVRYTMDAAEVIGRFHAERQLMASLHHDNIVGVLDGGTTSEGLPYLVMEYVSGMPLDRYCAERQPSVSERLNLFLQIATAVAHAHRNLVVHCDLKPSNILVTAEGRPKLLDFGIAKLLGPPSAEMAAYMTSGRRPLTPRYASPEQLLGRPVTTAVDVYSLGVILFEILTGGSPYRFETHSDAELVSVVCYQEAQRPSLAASANGRQLEGDLDAIVLKALRKEPESRYSSVEHFAADVRRHLSGFPVTARQGTWRYRAWKFAGRNRLVAGAAAVVAAVVLVGVSAVGWEGRVAMAARARAERRFNDVRQLAHYLLFDFHDAVEKLPGSTPVQEMLVKRSLAYLDGLASEAVDDPGLALELAEAYVRLGDLQGNPYNANLGDTAGAMASYKKALRLADALARAAPGNRGAMLAQARAHQNMGDVLLLLRQMKEAAAEGRLAASLFGQLVRSAPGDLEARIGLASSLEGLGDQLVKGFRERAEAANSYRDAHHEARRSGGRRKAARRAGRVSEVALDPGLASTRRADCRSHATSGRRAAPAHRRRRVGTGGYEGVSGELQTGDWRLRGSGGSRSIECAGSVRPRRGAEQRR
jgi:tetratricopeptide (TPR) repeat protein